MRVDFVRTDRVDQVIVPTVIEIAEHFSVKRSYVITFCKVIRNSWRWTIKDMPKQLNIVRTTFSKFRDGGLELCQILTNAFSTCSDKDDIDKLRGSLAEGLLLGAFGKEILRSETFGWGAQVFVIDDSKKQGIRYNCPFAGSRPNCSHRTSVDLGFWDGKYGEFFECKVRPDKVRCKEMSYMKYLNTELSQRDIDHSVYFVSTDTLEAMEMSMEEQYPEEDFYKLISLQEISA
ncbi:hypothetical protein [Bacillus glycinifermentans]|uniref:YqaJ viral recombinase domain-containing protein n=1 Tax=Bacillus glycinifermentans TaxID=1664069 RepID=A0A0T6BPY6_9BACI|nr:hypothetical protein [Bacillus glycinifermentans]ATH94562.1 hypothetical protein COP00_19865 [Bacillus glycinifermentans]KRT93701.1 hypothetical protein AB447_218090 [Bacillus glycinifermentans]MEC0486163.1 hypothetical protein [Bacillus glycinifermentans]